MSSKFILLNILTTGKFKIRLIFQIRYRFRSLILLARRITPFVVMDLNDGERERLEKSVGARLRAPELDE